MKRIKNVILNNIGLKILSMVLAIVVWFYIAGELNRIALEEGMGLKGGIPYRVAAKTFPIVVDVRGNVISGYKINSDKILITPQVCNAVGIKRLVDKVEFIKTAPIDVSEYTKTLTVRASLVSPAKGIKLVDEFATVVIPIEKEK